MSALRGVADVRTQVGEGPVWDDRAQVLWWVDVTAQRLFRFDPARYVTSAAFGMTAADLAKAPQAGGPFAIEPGVRGQAACRFAA